MLANNVDINVPNEQGSHALDVGQQEAIQLFLKCRADPLVVNHFGRTPQEVRDGRASLVDSASGVDPDSIRLLRPLLSRMEMPLETRQF